MSQINEHQQSKLLHLQTKTGSLAQIWLASTMTNLNRTYLRTDIVQSVEEISKATTREGGDDGGDPITLRVSGELLHGVVRVYSQKANFLLTDVSDLLHRLKSVFRGNMSRTTAVRVDTVARLDQVVLADTVTEMDVLAMPEIDFLDTTSSSKGLMRRERSMERHVQGANTVTDPWDMSLEVGRRYAPDDDLEQQTSLLDLNFELSDMQNSKSWGEGTHNSEEISANVLAESQRQELPGNEGIEREEDLDWNLGFTEPAIVVPSSDFEHDNSIEVGRRAVPNADLQETVDLGFDLDIAKGDIEATAGEQDAGQLQSELSGSISTSSGTTVSSQRRGQAALVNAKVLQVDHQPELHDRLLRDTPQTAASVDMTAIPLPSPPKKRAYSELASTMDFLPEFALDHFTAFVSQKRRHAESPAARTIAHEVSSAESVDETHIDISLDLNDDLLRSDAIEAGTEEEIEGEDAILDVPSSPRAQTASASPDLHEYSHISTEDVGFSLPRREVEVTTGDHVAKSTVDMANTIRSELMDVESTTFSHLLKSKYGEESGAITKSQASKAFFEMLVLATADCVDLSQQASTGDITITGKGALYEKFIDI
ncbi:AEL007Wp [Eremothecium gossypii ATCC 10895]|uniref:AEL007Wp n=1 Tax=Eremothecium gossypii (strain ATCC 10895 / CBS 109.51 / FGSC 9923 / NRRL Y-1056) TaxID=284811 RepID=Q757M9_EREGS|nr:AEL007Wp [Eremothecium gossypii ATCC 10895]AAS52678.2 AEL007Wp [Eremothecium gossypii ATCC 10895]AEY96983.1 FAEL007Wp [Eremothecium gossypii FDAG1]